jgi:hypothetical protein
MEMRRDYQCWTNVESYERRTKTRFQVDPGPRRRVLTKVVRKPSLW